MNRLVGSGIVLLLLILWKSAAAFFPQVPVGVIVGKNDKEYLSGIEYALRLHELNISAPFRIRLLVETIDDGNIYQTDRAVCSILSQGVFSIMAPTTSSTFNTLASYSKTFSVPLISPSLPIVPPEDTARYGVSIMPSPIRASLDILRHNNWNSVLYLYDTEDGAESFNRLLLLAADVHYINVLGIHRITSAEDAVIYMRKIGFATRGDKHVVLNTNYKLVYEIIKRFKHDIHIRKTNYHFLAMKPALDSFWENHTVEFRGLNLTGFRLIDPENERYRQFKYGWKKMNSDTKAASENLSMNAVLGYDGTVLLLGTVDLLIRRFYESSRRGSSPQFILNGTHHQCFEGNSDSTKQWKYGDYVSQHMKEIDDAHGLYPTEFCGAKRLCKQLEDLLGAVNTGLTGNMYFDSDGMRRNYTLEIIQAQPTGYSKVATWSDRAGFRTTRSDDTRIQGLSSQLQSKTLIVTTILAEPYIMLKEGSQLSGNDRYQGYCKDLTDILMEGLNASYELRLVADGTFGMDSPEGWTGMIGEVINRKADLAVAPLTLTSKRSAVVQFSQPFQTIGISLMMKKAGTRDVSPLSTSPFFFLYVFTKEVWICIIVAYAVITALLFIVTRYTAGPDRSRSNDNHKSQNSICTTLWFTMGTFLLRETGIHPKSIASRVLSCTWWAFTLAVISLYIANAATILVAHRVGSDSGINNAALSSRGILSLMEEALESGSPQLGCTRGGSTQEFFRNAKLDLYKRTWEHMEANPENYFRSMKEAVERVRKGNGRYAALVESSSNEYISHRQPCDTLMISGTLDTKGYAVAVSKGSPLIDNVNKIMANLQETGKLNELYDKWWVRTSECTHRYRRSLDEMYHDSMTIWEISGVFYFLLIGVAVVIAVTAAEYMYCARRNGGRRNKPSSDETST